VRRGGGSVLIVNHEVGGNEPHPVPRVPGFTYDPAAGGGHDDHRGRQPGRPGDIGLGDPFAMPYVTTESVLPLPGARLALVNDTNFGSRGRNPDLPDYSDSIVVHVPALGDAG